MCLISLSLNYTQWMQSQLVCIPLMISHLRWITSNCLTRAPKQKMKSKKKVYPKKKDGIERNATKAFFRPTHTHVYYFFPLSFFFIIILFYSSSPFKCIIRNSIQKYPSFSSFSSCNFRSKFFFLSG